MTATLTIADVARAAGVSASAVSFALNDRPGVSAPTRERILATAAELGWTPSSSARALSRRRADVIGLVLARPVDVPASDPFFPGLIAGIESELAPRGQALLLQMAEEGPDEVDRYQQLARRGRVDGVLLSDLRIRDRRPALLAQLGLTAVAIGRPTGRTPIPSVVLDDRTGTAAAVDHLVGLGHRVIAHVTGPRVYLHSRSRGAAFTAAARRSGLTRTRVVEADFTALGGATATRALLAGNDPPTAIVYASDAAALAGTSVAAAAGLRVPDDLSIIGFDDIELGRAVQPALTTIAGDPVGWGRAATHALLAAVASARGDGPAPPPLTELAPARLVVRGSTATPPGPRTTRPRSTTNRSTR